MLNKKIVKVYKQVYLEYGNIDTQINQGHCVSSDDIAEKLQYDLYYLKHRNIIWEIGILIKAIFLALGGRHD